MCRNFLLQFGAVHSMRTSGAAVTSVLSDIRESDRLDLELARDDASELLQTGSPTRARFTGNVPPGSDRAGLAGGPGRGFPVVAHRLLRSFRSLPLNSDRRAAPHVLPRLPRPFGVRPSRSLVGESVANLQIIINCHFSFALARQI